MIHRLLYILARLEQCSVNHARKVFAKKKTYYIKNADWRHLIILFYRLTSNRSIVKWNKPKVLSIWPKLAFLLSSHPQGNSQIIANHKRINIPYLRWHTAARRINQLHGSFIARGFNSNNIERQNYTVQRRRCAPPNLLICSDARAE